MYDVSLARRKLPPLGPSTGAPMNMQSTQSCDWAHFAVLRAQRDKPERCREALVNAAAHALAGIEAIDRRASESYPPMEPGDESTEVA